MSNLQAINSPLTERPRVLSYEEITDLFTIEHRGTILSVVLLNEESLDEVMHPHPEFNVMTHQEACFFAWAHEAAICEACVDFWEKHYGSDVIH